MDGHYRFCLKMLKFTENNNFMLYVLICAKNREIKAAVVFQTSTNFTIKAFSMETTFWH
jgi:hypothetical protein